MVPTALGASPLTRGKPRLIRARAASSGRIPAHAGKTHQPRPGNSRPRAHPRSRGENCVRSLRNTGVLGASPLTRGKRDVQPPSGVHEGRIPAHAGKTMPQSTGDRQFWAHPRSRGENGWPERHITPNQGASPLTRGKPRLNVIYKTIARRIPAHAGKTLRHGTATVRAAAHPRSRGENPSFGISSAVGEGASPLTRGKPEMGCLPRRKAGRIPAHAGKTLSTPRSGIHRRAHPRSRGENAQMNCAQSIWYGASPLTRGKRGLRRPGPARAGRIPAHAGKTHPPPGCPRRARAHPRSRGENRSAPNRAESRGGASPLTRGKPQCAESSRIKRGRIPAHAGKTPGHNHARRALRAHPRSRGENQGGQGGCPGPRGASPLTRGKRVEGFHEEFREGRIPAHAGKTPGGYFTFEADWAHPRSRGENCASLFALIFFSGASPLTRGKHRRRRTNQRTDRRIPAHAGKTMDYAHGVGNGPAHPRSRGENWRTCGWFLSGWGASPLTRGKRLGPFSVVERLGRIPAHAGKT